MDVDEPQSLIIVVSWKQNRNCVSIIRLETPPPVPNAPTPDVQWFHSSISAHVPFLPGFPPGLVQCVPPARSPEDLYMFPNWYNYDPRNLSSFPVIILNLRTNKCTLTMPPLHPKYRANAITLGDHIYYMAEPNYIPEEYPSFGPMSEAAYSCCFERYDTLSQSWEELAPLPPRSIYDTPPFNPLSCKGHIIGYAVLDDTILFCMSSCDMRAYNVIRNKWYTVKVSNNMCYYIVGEAVVVNNIIYALTSSCQSLVAITLLPSQENNEEGHDLVFTCDLLKEYVVPGKGEIIFELRNTYNWYKQLVHLGKDNFCLVQTCDRRQPFEYRPFETTSQYLLLTYIEVSEKKSIVTNICVHEFKVPSNDSFRILRCFYMQNCKSNAFKEAKGSFKPEHPAEVVTLPPELLQFLEGGLVFVSSQTDTIAIQDFEQGGSVHADTNKASASVVSAKSNVPFIPSTISAAVTVHKKKTGHKSSKSTYTVPSSGKEVSTLAELAASRKQLSTLSELAPEVAESRSNTDEEGDSVCVINLPFDFSFGQLCKELEKFGCIKSVFIHPDFSHRRDFRVADVEFESSASKQNAIKESRITIGRREVLIEEKKGTGLARV